MLKSLLPKEVKVNITIDDVGLKSILTTTKAPKFTKQSFLTILRFIKSHSGELGDIEGFVQLLQGSYKSDKSINLTGIDKFHLKCCCINGSFVNGTREPLLYSFALSSPTGYKIFKEPRIKLFKKIKKSILSDIRFYLEDDDYKPVDFFGERINFACQIIKI